MNSSWETKKLGKVLQTGAGGTPLKSHKEYYSGGTIPWLLSGELRQGEIYGATNFITPLGLQNSSARLFPKDTVLVAMYGATAGQVGILKFESATNQAVCGILPNDQYIPQFIYYYFLNKKDSLIKEAIGGAQPNISQIKIKNQDLPLISLNDQRRIASLLDSAFESIDKAKENVEKNLKNSKELFENHIEIAFKSKDLNWQNKSLGNLAEFRNGMNFTKSSKGEQINIVGVKDFQKNYWVPMELLDKVIIDGKLNDLDLLKKNDILTVRSNGNPALIGRCMLTGNIIERTSHSGFTIRIRLVSSEIYPEYLCYYLKSQKAKKQLVESGTGLNIKSLNQVSLSRLNISYPALDKQKDIVFRINKLSIETKKLEAIYKQKLTLLEELKKSILSKAFKGEL